MLSTPNVNDLPSETVGYPDSRCHFDHTCILYTFTVCTIHVFIALLKWNMSWFVSDSVRVKTET